MVKIANSTIQSSMENVETLSLKLFWLEFCLFVQFVEELAKLFSDGMGGNHDSCGLVLPVHDH